MAKNTKKISGGTREPIRLAEHFANSSHFDQLFDTGMKLIEESASYLDGEGREAAKMLDGAASLVYGTESMRLTTRLMQLASWLLLQRAANEGEMSEEQIWEEKSKVNLSQLPSGAIDLEGHKLPEQFVNLVNQSHALQKQVTHLDSELYQRTKDQASKPSNPVSEQIARLNALFGGDKTQ